jgi:hypothetical protein
MPEIATNDAGTVVAVARLRICSRRAIEIKITVNCKSFLLKT